jgi:hypothetical protein
MDEQQQKQRQQQPVGLASLPPEIIIVIFSQFQSFTDVFALASTCHVIRAVWQNNIKSIFEAVAPHDIQYISLARTLLADQGGALASSLVLSVDDVRRMVRNARKICRSVQWFGLEVASHTPSKPACPPLSNL